MKFYIVDAFTSELYKGNPAGVCLLDHNISHESMQKIAAEINLPETAFISADGDGYGLRWFTPGFEIDLCGHGTLAASFVICTLVHPEMEQAAFKTASGILKAVKKGNQFEMSFPQRPPKKIAVTADIVAALGIEPVEVYRERDLYAVVDSEEQVKSYAPDYDRLQMLDGSLGLVITARGSDADFVSRYFCTELKTEDYVTGSSHCSLAPLWRQKINQTRFLARQLSDRGGTLNCEVGAADVKISGGAVLFLQGELFAP